MQRRKKLLIIVFLSLLVIAGLMIPIMAEEAPSESTDKTETTEMPDNTTDASYVEGDVDSMSKNDSLGTFNPTQPPKPAETSEAKPTPESADAPESEPTPTPPPTPTSEPAATPEPTLTPDEDDGEHSVGNSDDNYEETSQPEEIDQADEDEQTDEIIGGEESWAEERNWTEDGSWTEEETTEPADFSFGRIWANTSGIIAEVRGNGIQAELNQIEASLDNSTLTVTDIIPYDREQHSSRIYILMDLSGYDSQELSAFKESVYSFIQTVGDNDTVVLIACASGSESQTVYSGSNKLVFGNAIKELSMSDDCEMNALIYEKIQKLIEESGSDDFDREYLIVFASGMAEPEDQSGAIRKLLDVADKHRLPIYSVVTSAVREDHKKAFEQLSKKSGGGYAFAADEDAVNTLLGSINDNVFLLELASESKLSSENGNELSVTIRDETVKQVIHVRDDEPEPTPIPAEAVASPADTAESAEETPVSNGEEMTGGKHSGRKILLIALIVIFLATFIVLMLSIQRPSSGKTANPPAKARKEKDDSAPAVKDEYRVRLRITSMNTMPREQEVRVVLNEPVYVGRDPGCAICVPDAKLSRKHFVILNEDGRLIVRDMQSTNGTFYNGRKLTVKTILKPDDYLLAGLSRVKVVSIR